MRPSHTCARPNDFKSGHAAPPGESHGWLLRMWIDSIPGMVERRSVDPQVIARDLITSMPAPLRTRCPAYPSLQNLRLVLDAVSAGRITVDTAATLIELITTGSR